MNIFLFPLQTAIYANDPKVQSSLDTTEYEDLELGKQSNSALLKTSQSPTQLKTAPRTNTKSQTTHEPRNLTIDEVNNLGVDSITVDITGPAASADGFDASAYGACAAVSSRHSSAEAAASKSEEPGYLNNDVTGTPLHHYLELQNSVASARSHHHYEEVLPEGSVRSRTENEYTDTLNLRV